MIPYNEAARAIARVLIETIDVLPGVKYIDWFREQLKPWLDYAPASLTVQVPCFDKSGITLGTLYIALTCDGKPQDIADYRLHTMKWSVGVTDSRSTDVVQRAIVLAYANRMQMFTQQLSPVIRVIPKVGLVH